MHLLKNQLKGIAALTVIQAEVPGSDGDFPCNSTSIKGGRVEVQLVAWEHHSEDPLQEAQGAQEEAQGDKVDQELEGRLITLQVVEAHPINHQG